jgi:uncharacterized radical SAM protein YgiQ
MEPSKTVFCESFEQVSRNKESYARAFMAQYAEQDAVRGRVVVQPHGDRFLVQNPPAAPLSETELDRVYALPFARDPHPMYDEQGGVPAIEEVRFSLAHNRGCFGGCSFCALTMHQGRHVTSRSHESVMSEAKKLVSRSDFKGYINDVGGPTANFRHPSCRQQEKRGLCAGRNCLTPEPCPNLDADHADYLRLLRKLRALPGVKKVFIRSGLRYDYLMLDPKKEALPEIVRFHTSGQLKVAPEHCSDSVLELMGKPKFWKYMEFQKRFAKLNERYGLKQFLVPYLMSSHPGSTLSDAVEMALYLRDVKASPEQVQDFYPTPGSLSTCMYYTELDPRNMQSVAVPKSAR